MRSAVGVAALVLTLPGTAVAAPSFHLRRVSALNGAGEAVFLGAPKGDKRVFVVDQRGVVRVLSGGHLKTFINLRSLLFRLLAGTSAKTLNTKAPLKRQIRKPTSTGTKHR